ncbi:hypothetical protein ANN_21416 [Periplaneta americana]|uniref:WH1 domain-containing protein n=1 Tax=Periplaneta americana TaxID=6978 RepID=A0ABQ8SF76_PERAM|nr:hypothetical protein ANN_21416 [Periplaneta americana]
MLSRGTLVNSILGICSSLSVVLGYSKQLDNPVNEASNNLETSEKLNLNIILKSKLFTIIVNSDEEHLERAVIKIYGQHWLNGDEVPYVTLEGYVCVSYFARDEYRYGGVIIYVRKDVELKCRPINLAKLCIQENFKVAVEYILKDFIDHFVTMVTLNDLSKAFDYVDHEILLEKMQYYGIKDLAPADFYLFPKVKSLLKEWRFASAEGVKIHATHTLREVTEDVLQECFEKCEQPIFSCKAHVFHIDPKTKRSWISASSAAVSVSFFYDSTRSLYRIISVEGTKGFFLHLRPFKPAFRNVLRIVSLETDFRYRTQLLQLCRSSLLTCSTIFSSSLSERMSFRLLPSLFSAVPHI